MAPKTGCTSVTYAMQEIGYEHVPPKPGRQLQWHQSEWKKDHRKVFALYRDPWSRLLSLWGHGITSGGQSKDLEIFIKQVVLTNKIPFYSWNQYRWYKNVGVDDFIHTIRLPMELNQKLGVRTKQLHMNKTWHMDMAEVTVKWPNAFGLVKDWIEEDLELLR